jgi:hypothetical protein
MRSDSAIGLGVLVAFLIVRPIYNAVRKWL